MNLKKIFKNKDIRSKLLFTVGVLLCFRLLASIPIPGIPTSALKELLSSSPFLQVLGLVSGGILEQISILTIGLGPYINASYIFQLLSVVFPQIKELYEGGPVERKMLTMYTRLLSIPLAVIQSLVIYTLLTQVGLIGFIQTRVEIVATIALFTFGAVITMWLGELISEFGLGGGSSVIILAGVLISIPANLRTSLLSLTLVWKQVLLIAVFLAIIVIAVISAIAVRKIAIVYARRVRTSGAGGISNYIPISVNPAGVMPVIFAISILDLPTLAFTYFAQGNNEQLKNVANQVLPYLQDPVWHDFILLFVLLFFTFFSAFLIFRPKEVAANLGKQGAYIEGIRPGRETESYLRKALITTAFFGAIILGFLTIAPNVFLRYLGLPELIISGTGALIVASVIMDVMRQIQSLLLTNSESKKYF